MVGRWNSTNRDVTGVVQVAAATSGYMYEHGRGVTQDDVRAVELYRQGCDEGSALGCGVPRNHVRTGQGGATGL